MEESRDGVAGGSFGIVRKPRTQLVRNGVKFPKSIERNPLHEAALLALLFSLFPFRCCLSSLCRRRRRSIREEVRRSEASGAQDVSKLAGRKTKNQRPPISAFANGQRRGVVRMSRALSHPPTRTDLPRIQVISDLGGSHFI
jgi:hypothetical protein